MPPSNPNIAETMRIMKKAKNRRMSPIIEEVIIPCACFILSGAPSEFRYTKPAYESITKSKTAARGKRNVSKTFISPEISVISERSGLLMLKFSPASPLIIRSPLFCARSEKIHIVNFGLAAYFGQNLYWMALDCLEALMGSLGLWTLAVMALLELVFFAHCRFAV